MATPPSIYIEAPTDELLGFYSGGIFDAPTSRDLNATHDPTLSSYSDSHHDYSTAYNHFPKDFSTTSPPDYDTMMQANDYSFTLEPPRSPTDAYNSPYSGSSLGDLFDVSSQSPLSPFASPLHASSSPSLSPITQQFGDFDLGHLSTDALVQHEESNFFRKRSFSTSDRTVAPSDTWGEDSNPRSRSASFSVSTASSIDLNLSVPGKTNDLEELEEWGHIGLDNNPLKSFSVSSIPDDFSSSGAPLPSEDLELSPEYPVSFLFEPPDAPVGAPPLTIQTDLNPKVTTSRHSHSKSHSELSSHLSPESPFNWSHERERMTPRSASGSPASRRHKPYPLPGCSPVSPPDEHDSWVPNKSPVDYKDFAIAKALLPDGLIPGNPPSSGPSLRRRHTGSAQSTQTLSIPQLNRGKSDPSSSLRYGPLRRHGADSLVAAPASPLFLTSPAEVPGMTEEEFKQLEESIVPGPKPIVASSRIVDASNSRRLAEGTFQCDIPSCGATFTKKHNKRNHMNSHYGIRPYQCDSCSYSAVASTTLARHAAKCSAKRSAEEQPVKAFRKPKTVKQTT